MGRMKLLEKVSNASAGQVEGLCIIKSAVIKSNVKGAPYLDLVLADAGGECAAKLWDYSIEQHGAYEADTVVKVRATINIWKDEEQLKIDRIRNLRPEELAAADMAELVPCAPMRGEEMYDKLYECASAFGDDDLRALTQYILRENRDALIRFPAALKLHHAVRGGLLYHTLTMLEVAKRLCGVYKELYPSLSSELVYAGVILHDVAKTRELVVGSLGLACAYSAEGQLLGHINIGASMVERAAAELMTAPEVAMLVQHMLLSHHGVPEFGSPRPPMFPEAELVSQIDLIDSRMYEMFDALTGVAVGGFSERQWALDNRQLYKHGRE
ncbi:MAG: 3'-5' exoribonuclease YhaM [Firmicutes bacterium ADurb.Bin248]|nr:MAG: 3'-5' exoribonuclease YhaM [Firmicutes bacterium ADurb.Bin248]HOF99596.1 HD domain-containing protein [Clostridia bacterium]HPK14530.1 HD domain-containing protein [Clostridia bacterium]